MDNFKVFEKLAEIQQALKAPKGQYNSFGKYKYRSCEDILEAVKPLCQKHDAALTVSDDLVRIGERFYVIAHAKLFDCETGQYIETQAFAREPDDKKGMDESQITGTASSYARKYALNGLFCIDDTKDADTDEYTAQTDGKTKNDQQTPSPCATAAPQNPTFQRANIVNEPIGVCSLCNKPLYSPGEGAKKNGVIYCMDCIKAGKV